MKCQDKWIMAVLVILSLGTLVGCGKSEKQEGEDGAPDGDAVISNFTLKDVEGKSVSFSELRGKVTLVDFWATWCIPCKTEMPHFQELYHGYKDRGLQVIGIALDKDPGDVRDFLKEEVPMVTYPILMATEEVKSLFGGIVGIPTTFVLDEKGRIYKKYIGFRYKETFEADIKGLL